MENSDGALNEIKSGSSRVGMPSLALRGGGASDPLLADVGNVLDEPTEPGRGRVVDADDPLAGNVLCAI